METKRNSSKRTATDHQDRHQASNQAPIEGALRTKSDKYPDPTILPAAERLAEFGKLLLRGIERRSARRSEFDCMPEVSKTQQSQESADRNA